MDLDRDASCAPALRKRYLAQLAPYLCFRVAVRAIEAWLLADAPNLARFLHVCPNLIPPDPESLSDP
ncbi:MAG: hypothetical protein RMI91_03400 [Gemmatales bacterium]|nr:hypothetical protein [Gemmatales bacterium]MDW7993677.1 hypothetical protein [Gemmatales bacterium]